MHTYRVYRVDPNFSVHTTDYLTLQQTTVDILDYPDSTFFLHTIQDVIQLRTWMSNIVYQGWTLVSNVDIEPKRLNIVKMLILIGQ